MIPDNFDKQEDAVSLESKEAEDAVIGCVLLDGSAMEKVNGYLSPGDFSQVHAKLIFSAMVDVFASGDPVDLVTVAHKLQSKGELKDVGGPEMLATVQNGVPTATHILQYAKIVKELSARRLLLINMSEISLAIKTGKMEAVESLEKTRSITDKLSSSLSVGDIHDVHGVISDIYENYDPSKEKTLSSGYEEIDCFYKGGFVPGELVVLAARPSMGKSAFSVNMCLKMAEQGLNIAIISLEMTKKEIAKRFMECDACLKPENMDSDDFGPWVDKMSSMNIFINDDIKSGISQVRSYVSRLKQRKGLDVVFIDYLQLLTGEGSNRYEKVTDISRQLKIMCIQHEITIVALSQLSRNVESRADKVPQLSDLRESGSIEQDADSVIMMMRPSYYFPEEPEKEKTFFYIQKNRRGVTGRARLNFNGDYMKFNSPKL